MAICSTTGVKKMHIIFLVDVSGWIELDCLDLSSKYLQNLIPAMHAQRHAYNTSHVHNIVNKNCRTTYSPSQSFSSVNCPSLE